MKYDIHITTRAERDISEAWDYIAHELLNPDAADRCLDSIEKAVRSLQEMPDRFRIIDDKVLQYWGIRFIRAGKYLIFYTISEDDGCVYIIRVLYEKRNWIMILGGEC